MEKNRTAKAASGKDSSKFHSDKRGSVMTSDPLRLAFIGGGVGSAIGGSHYAAISMDGRFKLVAGAFSSNVQINQESAAKWHIKRYYNSWRDLISKEKDNIDAVVILTPTPLHCDIICALLKEGVSVISEKPLVSSMEEIQKIKKIYDPGKHFLVVTYNYTGYPLVRELRQRILDGEFGRIVNIRLEMPQESFVRAPVNPRYPQAWRLQDGHIPTICLDLGAHLHQMALFLTEMEPCMLFATMRNFSRYSVVDDIEIQLKYDNGAWGHFWISKTAIGHRNGFRIRIYGEKGAADWYQVEPEILLLSYVNGEKKIIERGGNAFICNKGRYNRAAPGHSAGFVDAFANIYSDIGDALVAFKNKKEYKNRYVFGIDSAERGLRFFHRVRESHERECWLSV